MLISYKTRNFCSFAEEAEFDLLAPANKVKKRFPDNYTETKAGYDILKTAVIIGENAGGKTNFINSLAFFKSLFEDNKHKKAYRSLINANYLKSSSPEQCDTLQTFDITIMGNSGTIYHYILALDEYSIVQEIFSYRESKSGHEKFILSVLRDDINKQQDSPIIEIASTTTLDNCEKNIEKMFSTVPSSKALSLSVLKLSILGDPHALEFVNWINNNLIVESKRYNYNLYKDIQNEEDDLRILKDSRFLDIVRMVDYSICEIEIDDERPFSKSRIIRKSADGRSFSRDLDMDSAGVGEFFAWAVQLFRVVYENKTVFADEMDRVINPILSERMVAFVNGNKHTGQFIFSSHNVLHLDLKNYMKEQIYFVTKNREDLNSELYSLADFPEIRYETTKIYEFYMKGILGGTAFE